MTDLMPVKYFNNSELSINLTSILILNNETNEFEPWFIAKEVATLLGYDDTVRAVNRNVRPDDQKIMSYDECKSIFGGVAETIENTEDFGGDINNTSENSIKINNNGMKFINESGLYDLILESKKPEAKVFRRWVTSKVLPSIRKTGSYNVQQQLTPSYMIEDRIKRASVWIEEQKHKLVVNEKQLRCQLQLISLKRIRN